MIWIDHYQFEYVLGFELGDDLIDKLIVLNFNMGIRQMRIQIESVRQWVIPVNDHFGNSVKGYGKKKR